LLHQSFTVDAAAAANQVAPLIGERTPIVLQAAKKEMQQAPDTDSAKPTTVIISIVLKLKSSPA
jgi:ABC-type molybdate transport system permease subunit